MQCSDTERTENLFKQQQKMDEELDYMSEAFLQSCVNAGNIDRPGLIKSLGEKRKHELMKKKTIADEEKKKSKKSDEMKKLEEGLQAPISSDNKGFSMLQKMGFKSGMGLGKTNSGIIEPIQITLKRDRHGFGREEALKQIQQHKDQLKRRRLEKLTNVDDYRDLISKRYKERTVANDLRKSQRICRCLDEQSGVEKPIASWFWPDDCIKDEESSDQNNLEKDESEESELCSLSDSDCDFNTDKSQSKHVGKRKQARTEDVSDIEPAEKLEVLTNYLRNTYLYCVWCSYQYSDKESIEDCPGPTRDLH